MSYLNRNLCEVLQDMRTCHKNRNYAGLKGLIEEAQTMGNRMEDGLEERRSHLNDLVRHEEDKTTRRALRLEVKGLQLEAARLQNQIEEYTQALKE